MRRQYFCFEVPSIQRNFSEIKIILIKLTTVCHLVYLDISIMGRLFPLDHFNAFDYFCGLWKKIRFLY